MVRDAVVAAGVMFPLALDTFALSAVLGFAGIAGRQRLRASLVLSAFEGVMPIVGFIAGAAIGKLVGGFADYIAVAVLAATGALMLRPRSAAEEQEEARVRLLARAQGVAIIGLGLGISLDELTIGFGLGLIGLPLPLVVVWAGLQAFVAAQVGMRLGGRVGEAMREGVERLAGALLLLAAAGLLALRLSHSA